MASHYDATVRNPEGKASQCNVNCLYGVLDIISGERSESKKKAARMRRPVNKERRKFTAFPSLPYEFWQLPFAMQPRPWHG